MVLRLFRVFTLVLASLWILSAQAQNASSAALPPPTVAYITAHPDDWQLFMGADACDDVRQHRNKVVFICLTSGQADHADDAYWQGREAGCQAAVQKAVNLAAPGNTAPVVVAETANGHRVTAVRYRNTVTFFLHLPDGNLDGKGQSRGGFQSMSQLFRTGRPMTPLDGSAPYTSWADLVSTVRALLQREAGASRLNVHTPQSNQQYNPRDHSDHRMAGQVAQAATAQTECRYTFYVGYDASRRPLNLNPTQTANQRAVYEAYSQTMVSRGQPSSWDNSHLQFIGRQYSFIRHCAGQQRSTTSTPATLASQNTPDVDDDTMPSASVVLEPNYPNPFNESSLLAYQLPAPAPVWLRILDSQGREILRLLQGDTQTAGRHEQWLDVNSFPASGLYIAELRVGNERRTCRLEIIR